MVLFGYRFYVDGFIHLSTVRPFLYGIRKLKMPLEEQIKIYMRYVNFIAKRTGHSYECVSDRIMLRAVRTIVYGNPITIQVAIAIARIEALQAIKQGNRKCQR